MVAARGRPVCGVFDYPALDIEPTADKGFLVISDTR